jgi:hypothetical protein
VVRHPRRRVLQIIDVRREVGVCFSESIWHGA